MSWYQAGEARIHYQESGDGDPVLLLPGWAGNIAELDGLRRELAGCRVIAADLPGSGRSLPQPREYGPDFYARDARAFLGLLDELEAGPAHLAGFSDGGEIALLMAGLEPGCALSVLTWGAAGQVVPVPGRLEALECLLDEPSGDLVQLAAYLAEAYGPDAARVMARTWAGALRRIIDAGGDISLSLAGSIRCPVLLVTGTYDPYCPPDLVRQLAAVIPSVRLVEVDAGHDLHRSHLDWLARTLLDWIASH